MRKHRFWTWLSLNLLIGRIHPRVLYYLNRLASIRQTSRPNAAEFASIFHRDFPRAIGDNRTNGNARMPPPEFLTNGHLRSAEGSAAFKLLPTSDLIPDYLECQLEGLTYFDAVFRGQDTRRSSFNELMVEHHRILAAGKTGERNYKIRGNADEHSRDIAGKMRSMNGRVACALIDRDRNMVDAILHALTEVEFYPVRDWDIPTDGIPKEAWSSASRIRRGFQIRYTDGNHIPLYFSRMAECLSLIRRLSANAADTANTDQALLLGALATYFHLGIHAHAFVRINQSLLWAQVNYVLMMNRMRPAYHGYVDLVAAFLDIENFRNYFRRHILASHSLTQQPNSIGPGQPHHR